MPAAPPHFPAAPAPAAVTDAATGIADATGLHIDRCSTLHEPEQPAACRVLVLYAHPSPHASRINRRLAQAASRIDGVWVDDLYETYPEFYIDVARERSLLAGAAALVLLYPTEWHAPPALMKEWFDVVLHDAWQAQPGHNAQAGRNAQGMPRQCWIVTSTGAGAADYRAGGRFGQPFEAFLAPVLATAATCGMHNSPPLVLHDAHDIDSASVDAHVARFADGLLALLGRAGAMQSPALASLAQQEAGHGR